MNQAWVTLGIFGAAFWPFVKFALWVLLGAGIFGVGVAWAQRKARG